MFIDSYNGNGEWKKAKKQKEVSDNRLNKGKWMVYGYEETGRRKGEVEATMAKSALGTEH